MLDNDSKYNSYVTGANFINSKLNHLQNTRRPFNLSLLYRYSLKITNNLRYLLLVELVAFLSLSMGVK